MDTNRIIERVKNEPVFLLILAGVIVAFGIDLVELGGVVEGVLQLIAMLGAAKVAREQVIPARKLEPEEPTVETY